MVVRLGQQDNVGQKPIVILYTYYINRHADKRHDKLGLHSICYIGSRIGWVSMKEIFKSWMM